MKPVTRTKYLSALRAAHDAYSIFTPTPRLLARLCPHLSSDQMSRLLAGTTPVVMALPPVLVDGAFHIAEFRPAERGHPSVLRVGNFASNMLARFSQVGRYYDEAVRYADRQWRGTLVPRTWSHTQTVYVEDPDVLTNVGKMVPRTSHIIWIGLSSKAVLDKFRSPDEWNSKIAIASLDHIEGLEIEGGEASLTAYNCFRCGGGLHSAKCLGCNRILRDQIYGQYRASWNTPLPPKLVKLLEKAGHKFETKAA